MSKRFTDTEKWKKESFDKLSLKMKLAWIYLCDNCDHAGIWQVNFKLMSFQVGEEITKDEFINAFWEKIQWIDDSKIFIQSFVDFQYGTLNPNSKVHKSVLMKLATITLPEGYPKGMDTTKDKTKAKAKEEDRVKDKEKEEEKEIPIEIVDEAIPADIYAYLTISLSYPVDIVEEIRKDARLKFISSIEPDKNWHRFVGNYFKLESNRIRQRLIDMAKNLPKPLIAHLDCKLCDNSGRAVMIEKKSGCEFAFRCICSRGAEHAGLPKQFPDMEEEFTHFKSWSVGNFDRRDAVKNHRATVAI